MDITTTPSIDGKRIRKYCGVVAGEAILGANIFKDLFAGIRDIVGGRSAAYEEELQNARMIALQECKIELTSSVPMPSSASISTTKFCMGACSWFRLVAQRSSLSELVIKASGN